MYSPLAFAVSPTSAPAAVDGIVRKDKSSSSFRSAGEKRSKSFDLPPIGESKTENHFTAPYAKKNHSGKKKSFGQHLKKSITYKRIAVEISKSLEPFPPWRNTLKSMFKKRICQLCRQSL